MGRTAKIAGAAVAGGVALTIALVAALEPPAPRAFAPLAPGADALHRDDIARCRTVTTADAECAAAWEARRRQFFGQQEDVR
jgi:conjugative transfer region protein TrbK